MSEKITYQRGLKKRHVSLIALGGIIGSSYFLGTGYILNQIGPYTFLAYALGGLITYMTMACLAELTLLDPTHGSFISFSEKYLSKSIASGVGWSYWISWIVYIPSECVAGGILLHYFIPEISVYIWASFLGAIVTVINLIHVKLFGEIEFWLAIVKIGLIVLFSILAIGIFFGLVGNEPTAIGGKYFFPESGPFPHGIAILFINMVILLSNFQGSEIIGLSAAESEHPEETIPSALKKISIRIVGLYLLPTFLVALIYPYQEANLSGSVFALALEKYGLIKIGKAFSFFIIAGAISTANSGLYATIRSLHALSEKSIAPSCLKKINSHGVPINATLFTLVTMWGMLLFSYFFSAHDFYANLLAISGFTGSICWIAICIAQLKFRKVVTADFLNLKEQFLQVPFYPYFTYFSVSLQIFCLLIVGLTPSLRSALYLGIPAVCIPIAIEKYKNRFLSDKGK